ncbi:MAG: lysine methyltransferase METTL21B [Trebouxia sp. A1-2]|nr:MAG: lysine methyltransferase METTL21B [Trebouxia sp. A1-2]
MATGAGSSEEQAALLAEQGEFAAAICSFNTGLLPDANHKFSQYLDTQPHNVEVQAELAEVKHLQQQQLALAVGLPGLQIEQSYGCAGMTDLVRGKRVLELGCGTGVVGITLACLGADVTLTDIAAIVPHTKYNIQCNQQLIQFGCGKAAEAALDWNSPSSSQSLLAKQYDLLVGADLIYAVKDISPLTDTLQQLWQRASDCPLTIAHKACRRFDLEGIIQDMLTCCREAIAAAQARQDIYLEEAASQGKDSAVKQSGIWLGMLEAVCLRACGNATPTIEQMTQMPPTDPVRTCATSLVNILVRLAEAYETLETPDLAESALRQALEYASLTGRPRKEQKALLALSRTFEYHQTARRQQSVRDKAAIYRQHLFAAAPNLA